VRVVLLGIINNDLAAEWFEFEWHIKKIRKSILDVPTAVGRDKKQ
jgi:hypothetical protein